MAKDALLYSNVGLLQKNILDGMEAIRSQLGNGEVRKISFIKGRLQLTPTSARTSAVLPPDDVIRSLIN